MAGSKPIPEVWFITGASSGLGLSVLKHVLSKGHNAVATLRKPEVISDLTSRYPSSQLLVLELDVKNEEKICTAFRESHTKFGRIDVVYNNAGYSILSEIEGTPPSLSRDMFEVNFWGASNVSKEAVRIFRDMNKPAGGRLLQASSQSSVSGTPGLGYYSASKFALEGFSEALAYELLPSWNIKIIILQFGCFVTRGVENLLRMPVHESYEGVEGGGSKVMRSIFDGSHLHEFGNADKAAREVYNIASEKDAPLRIPLGFETINDVIQKADAVKQDAMNSKKWSLDLM